MSTVGVFILLLVAFVVLHRLYMRPQVGMRRRSRGAAPAPGAARREAREPRDNPGDPGRESEATAHGAGGGVAGGTGASGGDGDGGPGDGD
jgi:hypothetical protein